MPAKKADDKKKKAKEEKEESSDEEVIEVKTTRKVEESKEEKPEVGETEKSGTKDTKGVEITSFSQLDADDDKKEDEIEEKEESEVEEKPAEEKSPAEESSEKEVASQEEAKKWLKGITPEIETEGEGDKKSKLKTFLIIIGIAAVIGVITGGVFYYREKVSEAPEEAVPTPTETPATSTPTPTETEEGLDFSEYAVSILNGSGIHGEDGAIVELLTDAGFAEFETGNADSYDYLKTEVSTKEDTPVAVYNKIEEALSNTYDVSKSESFLSEDSSFDVIVIVGAKK